MENTGDMNSGLINKMDPRYIAACITQLPTLKDPQEVGIIDIIKRDIFKTPLGERMIRDEKKAVMANLKGIYNRRGDLNFTLPEAQKTAAEISRIVNARIVSGKEHLEGLEKGKPVFFSANHYGAYKLVGLRPEDLSKIGFKGEHPIPDIYYPPVAFHAAFYPVAEELGDGLCLAAFEEPGILGELSRASGYIDVPPTDMTSVSEGGGRVAKMVDTTGNFFIEHPSYAVVVFPEGGTTGKRTGGNLYELGKFHSGLFAIASQLEVPIVLLAHDFNPDKGFEVAIAGVTRLNKNNTRGEIQETADHARELTQVALSNLHARQ